MVLAPSAEEPSDPALQVMSPSATAGRDTAPQQAEVMEGSLGALPNGVTPRELQPAMSESRPGAGEVIPSTVDDFLSSGRTGRRQDASDLTEAPAAGSAQVAVPSSQATGGQASVAAAMALEDGSVHAVRANVEVQQGSSSLTVVRWISRLNELLTNQGQSVLGSVGLNTTPTQGP
ncbi:GIP [Symbiodinium sp. CCMP2592]|nr:GIP [Symbiodinium sp. CCMP2592]